jgi:hypothetical protein
MKQANAAVIALLADSKQFVMWETFTFDMPDGSQIVYTTYDQDAPAVVVAGIDFMLDTFTGNGTLATHLPEIGTAWKLIADQSPITDFSLDGSGAVEAAVGSSSYLSTDGVPGTDDVAYTITGVIEFVGAPTDSEIARCSVYAFDDGVNFFGWECELYVGDGQTSIQLFLGASPDGIESQTFGADTGLPVSGTYTLRVQVNSARNVVTAFVDDVNIGSVETILTLPSVGVCGMSMNGIATANPKLHSIEGVET